VNKTEERASKRLGAIVRSLGTIGLVKIRIE
jgi:hypothetical protein